ncbi:unnamed protein product [Symbiodinium sp. CCMP2592]|nr:unnamed protein product [Symbiodinium sp. CCMP2592]
MRPPQFHEKIYRSAYFLVFSQEITGSAGSDLPRYVAWPCVFTQLAVAAWKQDVDTAALELSRISGKVLRSSGALSAHRFRLYKATIWPALWYSLSSVGVTGRDGPCAALCLCKDCAQQSRAANVAEASVTLGPDWAGRIVLSNPHNLCNMNAAFLSLVHCFDFVLLAHRGVQALRRLGVQALSLSLGMAQLAADSLRSQVCVLDKLFGKLVALRMMLFGSCIQVLFLCFYLRLSVAACFKDCLRAWHEQDSLHGIVARPEPELLLLHSALADHEHHHPAAQKLCGAFQVECACLGGADAFHLGGGWRRIKAEEPDKLDRPMRCALLVCLFAELKSRMEKVVEERMGEMAAMCWLAAGPPVVWNFMRWDAAKQQQVVDNARPPLTQAEEMKGQNLVFLLQTGQHGVWSAEMRDGLRRLCHCSVMHLLAAQLRKTSMRVRRSPMPLRTI